MSYNENISKVAYLWVSASSAPASVSGREPGSPQPRPHAPGRRLYPHRSPPLRSLLSPAAAAAGGQEATWPIQVWPVPLRHQKQRVHPLSCLVQRIGPGKTGSLPRPSSCAGDTTESAFQRAPWPPVHSWSRRSGTVFPAFVPFV